MSFSVVSAQHTGRARELGAYFAQVRETTLRLTRHLSAEDQMLQSTPDASPTKWHLAHTTWFFETFILQTHLPGYRPFDDRYKYLFNSYYKQLGRILYEAAEGSSHARRWNRCTRIASTWTVRSSGSSTAPTKRC